MIFTRRVVVGSAECVFIVNTFYTSHLRMMKRRVKIRWCTHTHTRRRRLYIPFSYLCKTHTTRLFFHLTVVFIGKSTGCSERSKAHLTTYWISLCRAHNTHLKKFEKCSVWAILIFLWIKWAIDIFVIEIINKNISFKDRNVK